MPRIAIVGSFDLDDLGDSLALRLAGRELRRRVWRADVVLDGPVRGSRYRDAEQPEPGDGNGGATTFELESPAMLALTPRLLGEGERQLRVDRLRRAEVLPDGDLEIVASDGALTAGGVELPASSTADDLVSVLSWAGRVEGDWEQARRIAASFGRPVDPAVVVDALGVDRVLDDVAARAIADADPSEAAWAEREAELQAVIRSLTFELVEKDIRFVRLWRKIHEGDRHYHWHKRRADEAEAHLQRVEHEVWTLRKLLEDVGPDERERTLLAELDALRDRLDDPNVALATRLQEEVSWLRSVLEDRDEQIAQLRRRENPLRRGASLLSRRLRPASDR